MIEEQEIHLRDYLRVIQKRKSIIATFFVITFIVVLIGTFSATPIYQASTQILVEKSDNTPLTGGGYYYNSYDPEFFGTQSQIIRSHNVARKVVDILSLDTNYEKYFPAEKNKPSVVKTTVASIKSFFANLLPSSNSFDAAHGASGKAWEKSKADIIATTIKSGVIVSPVEESRLLNIRYKSENPEFARLIANTVAQAYMEEVMAIKLNSSGYAIKWMTEKADAEKTKLAQSEKALQNFMKEQDIITIEDRITIIPQKLADLSARMTSAETRREELETVRAQVAKLRQANVNTETISVLAENKVLQALRDQILKAEQNISELSQKYGEKHPVMIKARSELKILQEKKAQEIDSSIQSINNEYELARNNELNVRRQLDQTKNEALNLNEKFIQYGIFKREVDTNRALYEALNIRIKEQGVTEDTQQVNVWVTEQAEMPQSPVSPKKMRNLLLGVVLGLFGGIGFAFFLEYLDNTVKDPSEVEARTGVNVLGVVELFDKEKGISAEIATRRYSESTFAENFKALRTSVLLSSAENPPKKILVTSMMPAEGKTTIASNLAMTLAMAENKVLLIDGDMRRPSLHKVYGLPNSKGLSSYLAGVENEGLVHQVDDADFYIMPSGPIPPNPSELLSSKRLQAMLLSLEKRFDFIIIDSAPLLGATDSLLISKVVDGTIFVSRAGKTTYDALRRGFKSYDDIQSLVLGVVINAIDMKQSEYQHYYGYYNYNYGSEDNARG
ncbi:MAG: polysaccharide biosynthesis tyrosine autokinase [Desulfobulbaceae bacterium]|uniref:non-specific protein-tyrosine kinase n=1 Tax=Candidatus Desulfobia pelagia TaxID=2841692 RepID=A0A8J6NBP8_9BACT|nr:polysaccharide biosynthesis tyrosine autokinase [Candidatus Desulfobia pelagia]